MQKIKKIFTFFVSMGLCILSPQLSADDTQARGALFSAAVIYDENDRDKQERTFELLYDAYGQATSFELRQEVSQRIIEVYSKYTQYIKQYGVPFLDSEDSSKESLYRKLALYGDARGMRLYALVLAQKKDLTCMDWIAKAAQKGDAPAMLEVAELTAIGYEPFSRDVNVAYQWLQKAASQSYAPAWERLAEIHWDGDANWNAQWNQSDALYSLNKALELYSVHKYMNPENIREEFLDHIKSLEHIKADMQSFIGYNTGQIMPNFYPSFLAMRLSSFSESEAGLRARAYYIQQHVERYAGSYYLSRLPTLDLSLVPIRLSYSKKNWGLASLSYQADTITLQIDIHAENMPYVTDEKSRWAREVYLNQTIAHELGHCYLCLKYPSIFKSDYAYHYQLVEGHATNVEYAFANAFYFNYKLTPDDYYNRYRYGAAYGDYYRWFRANCIQANDTVNWSVIEQHERAASPTGDSYKIRKLISGSDGVFKEPLFFRY